MQARKLAGAVVDFMQTDAIWEVHSSVGDYREKRHKDLPAERRKAGKSYGMLYFIEVVSDETE